MKKSTLYLKAITNIVIYIISIALVIVVLPWAINFFLPFIIGWIISLIANPVVKFFEEKIKFKRKAMSAIMIVLIIALIILAGYALISLFVTQGIGFVQSMPEKWAIWKTNLDFWSKSINNSMPEKMRDSLSSLGTKLEEQISHFISSMGANSEFATSALSTVTSKLGSIATIIIGIIMCVLSAYLFTAEHNNIVAGFEKYAPKALYMKVEAAYRGLKKAVSGYIKAQLKIEFWVYIITLIGLIIVNVDYSVIIAFLVAILDILPFFGAGLIMVPWGIYHILNAHYFLGIGLLVTWAIGQLVRQLIQPKLIGDSVGLPPIPTLFSLFIGYKVLGVFGMVIAVPIAMILISLYEEGVFTTLVSSLVIIRRGIADFRKLPEEALRKRFEKDESGDENEEDRK